MKEQPAHDNLLKIMGYLNHSKVNYTSTRRGKIKMTDRNSASAHEGLTAAGTAFSM